MIPKQHLRGFGCKKCNCKERVSKSTLTKEQFIIKAKKVHDTKYDYNESVYCNCQEKIKIFCNNCKEYFWQSPANHLMGNGCPKCGKERAIEKRRIGMNEFIKRAYQIHKDKYDYSLVIYKNEDANISIVCKNCGKIFQQTPKSHLRGSNCPYCVGKAKITLDVFLEKSHKIHGEKYNYDAVNFINNKTKVKIFCKRCNDYFYQTPSSHLAGCGCKKCATYFTHQQNAISFEEFKNKLKKWHNNGFEYDEKSYNGMTKKMRIKCTRCNKIFEQTPYQHVVMFLGCPYCRASSGEQTIQTLLETYKIKYIFQKRFKNCRDIHTLPFDFYLPDYNLCIE